MTKTVDYEIKETTKKDYRVYEYGVGKTSNTRCVAIFDDFRDAQDFIEMIEIKEKFMEEISKGNIKSEKIPF